MEQADVVIVGGGMVGLTLAALLDAQGVDANQIATAVNGKFVPRALRTQTWLSAGDTVLTFQAIVGG